MSIEFEPFPKIARLNRNITITEKIDGTNAAVVIVRQPLGGGLYPDYHRLAIVVDDARRDEDGTPECEYHVYAQSRSRFITATKAGDNYGFAAWVKANAEALVATLGEGRHFGEWWGAGIQRGYGLTGGDKRFSLFNAKRWGNDEEYADALEDSGVPGLGVVPVIYEGPFDQPTIQAVIDALRNFGSVAALGFMRPEGIVVWHDAARQSFKVTLEGDEAPKGVIGHALDEERAA